MSPHTATPAASPHPLVYIVMLNYRNPLDTLSAVESLLQMDYPNFKLLVVENGSGDDSAQRLRSIRDNRCQLIERKENGGYTGGCNVGMKFALDSNADFIWLLNNDAIVPPHTLSSLVRVAQSDSVIGLVSPLIASLDEVPHLTFAGGLGDVKSRLYSETNNIDVAKRWAREKPSAGLVIGTAMLVRASLIRKIGFHDDSFFMYYEDIDLNIRSSQAGYRNVVDYESTVYHFEKNRDDKPLGMTLHYWYYNARNARRFWRKHLGFWKSLRISWWSFNTFISHYNCCRARADAQEAILAGLWHGWLGRTGIYDPKYRMPAAISALVRLYSRRAVLQCAVIPGEPD